MAPFARMIVHLTAALLTFAAAESGQNHHLRKFDGLDLDDIVVGNLHEPFVPADALHGLMEGGTDAPTSAPTSAPTGAPTASPTSAAVKVGSRSRRLAVDTASAPRFTDKVVTEGSASFRASSVGMMTMSLLVLVIVGAVAIVVRSLGSSLRGPSSQDSRE